MECVLVLHNIRSTHNVGSIFRTADAAGVAKVILCGYTPSPTDRFGRERSDIAKVALGAEKSLPWEYAEDTTHCLEDLRSQGYFIAVLEQDAAAQNILEYSLPTDRSVALVLGNETEGISEEILKLSDVILEIPMHGTKESLNVSVAAGVALFTLL